MGEVGAESLLGGIKFYAGLVNFGLLDWYVLVERASLHYLMIVSNNYFLILAYSPA